MATTPSTGGTDAPARTAQAICGLTSGGEAGKHAALTITAGSGQCAVSAKRLDLAAHIVLTGGEGAPAVTPETEIMKPDRCDCTGTKQS